MFRLLVVTLLLLSLSACGSSTEPSSAVEVQAALSDSAVLAGEPVSVSVAVRNRSTGNVFVTGTKGCFAWVEVRRMPDLEIVFEGDPRVCEMAAVRHLVAPGTDLVDQLPLSTASDSADLGPGVYRIRAGVRIEGEGIAWSSSRQLEVIDH